MTAIDRLTPAQRAALAKMEPGGIYTARDLRLRTEKTLAALARAGFVEKTNSGADGTIEAPYHVNRYRRTR